MSHLRLSRDKLGRVVLKFEGKKFKLQPALASFDDASMYLGLSADGLRNAVNSYIVSGVNVFNVPYVPPATREDTENGLRAAYSGVDLTYLGCIISALSDTSNIPCIVCTGVSGAGKSGTARIAAKITGNGIYQGIWSNRPERNIREIENACRNSAKIALFDEFAKFGRSSPDILNSIMLFTKSRFAQNVVCVFTDTTIPGELFRIRQITRRTRFFNLTRAVQWPDPDRVLELCPLAPNLVRYAPASWQAPEHDTRYLINLFNAIIAAPALSGKYAHRKVGIGWKAVDFENPDRLTAAWMSVSDASIGGSRFHSMQLAEIDLAQTFGAPGQLVIDSAPDTVYNCLFIRILWKNDDKLIINALPAEVVRVGQSYCETDKRDFT